MKKQRKKGQKKPSKPSVMPGLDYGIARTTAVMTEPVFNDQMRKADIIACAYGEMGVAGISRVVPCISMVARNPGSLKEAFQQFHAWIQATGPGALKVEILYSREGYYIAFGPEYKHAMWRTVGIDQFVNPMFFGMTYIKTIDTRNPLLDALAEYSKRPFAPIMLLGAHYTGKNPQPASPNPAEIQPIDGCPDLLLYNLPVYKTKEEVPEYSGLHVMTSKPTKEELEKSRAEYEQRMTSPEEASLNRERGLATLMPVTLHMLRTYPPLREKLAVLEAQGVARWQIEQAIINQRLWSQVVPERRVRLQNQNDLYRTLASFTELDTPSWDTLADDQAAILGQILRDARALLKRIKASTPRDLADCQKELAAHGFLGSKDAA
jgi:hypothetical protein